MIEFIASRVMSYVVFSLIYIGIYNWLGFEITVLIGIGTILGELHHIIKENDTNR